MSWSYSSPPPMPHCYWTNYWKCEWNKMCCPSHCVVENQRKSYMSWCPCPPCITILFEAYKLCRLYKSLDMPHAALKGPCLQCHKSFQIRLGWFDTFRSRILAFNLFDGFFRHFLVWIFSIMIEFNRHFIFQLTICRLLLLIFYR